MGSIHPALTAVEQGLLGHAIDGGEGAGGAAQHRLEPWWGSNRPHKKLL
jgi:hypothetical protein